MVKNTTKLFVGSFPSLAIRERLSRVQGVTEPIEKMHVTVSYLGEQDLDSFLKKFNKLQQAFSNQNHRFHAYLRGAGEFKDANVSWAGVGPVEDWQRLRDCVNLNLGMPVNLKRMIPHITLVHDTGFSRLKSEVKEIQTKFLVDQIHLLTSKDGKYQILSTISTC